MKWAKVLLIAGCLVFLRVRCKDWKLTMKGILGRLSADRSRSAIAVSVFHAGMPAFKKHCYYLTDKEREGRGKRKRKGGGVGVLSSHQPHLLIHSPMLAMGGAGPDWRQQLGAQCKSPTCVSGTQLPEALLLLPQVPVSRKWKSEIEPAFKSRYYDMGSVCPSRWTSQPLGPNTAPKWIAF